MKAKNENIAQAIERGGCIIFRKIVNTRSHTHTGI